MVAVMARGSAVAAERARTCIADGAADTRPLWDPADTHTRQPEALVPDHKKPSAAASCDRGSEFRRGKQSARERPG